ncbi:hypothetical protein SK128_002008, partial [Halocaridina rubra]
FCGFCCLLLTVISLPSGIVRVGRVLQTKYIMANKGMIYWCMALPAIVFTYLENENHMYMREMDEGHVNPTESVMDDLLQQSDWLPVGQMVTDLGQLFSSEQTKTDDESQDDESMDMSYERCVATLGDIAEYPKYITNHLVKMYTLNDTLDTPDIFDEQNLKGLMLVQEKLATSGLTDDDLEAAALMLHNDKSEESLKQELEMNIADVGTNSLQGDFLTRVMAVARSLVALQNLRCRNLCTSSVCMQASDLCSNETCRFRKCPMYCYESNLRYPFLNLCRGRPNAVHENRMFCCPHRFHPKLNVTGDNVICYC